MFSKPVETIGAFNDTLHIIMFFFFYFGIKRVREKIRLIISSLAIDELRLQYCYETQSNRIRLGKRKKFLKKWWIKKEAKIRNKILERY